MTSRRTGAPISARLRRETDGEPAEPGRGSEWRLRRGSNSRRLEALTSRARATHRHRHSLTAMAAVTSFVAGAGCGVPINARRPSGSRGSSRCHDVSAVLMLMMLLLLMIMMMMMMTPLLSVFYSSNCRLEVATDVTSSCKTRLNLCHRRPAAYTLIKFIDNQVVTPGKLVLTLDTERLKHGAISLHYWTVECVTNCTGSRMHGHSRCNLRHKRLHRMLPF